MIRAGGLEKLLMIKSGELLKAHEFHGFPVVSHDGGLVGHITRCSLCTAIGMLCQFRICVSMLNNGLKAHMNPAYRLPQVKPSHS